MGGAEAYKIATPEDEIICRMSKSVRELEDALNQELQRGNILDAFERFYSEDVMMQENALAPCCGKSANRERVRQWADTVADLHSARLIGSAVSGDRAYSEWEYDATYKNGRRHKMNEVAMRQWQNEKVVFERFYWDPTTYPYQI
jgi:ketosteroid isomerase-like protein